MKIVHILPPLWVATLAGCAVESPSPRLPDVVDSAGVRIVINHAPQWLAQDTWRVAAEPRLVIGGRSVAEAQALYQVAGALMRRDRIIIANAGTHEIRFYDVDGRLRSRVGGEGDGPGEFRRIARLQRLARDSLMVFDGAARRVTVLGGDGGFGRTARLVGAPGAWVVPHGGFADGRMLASEMVVLGKPGPGRSRTTLTLRVYNVDGSAGDSVGVDYYQEMYRELVGRRIRPWPPPFRRQPMTIARDDRFATGSMDVYEIRVREPSGRLRLIVRRSDPLTPVSPRCWKQKWRV